MHPPVRVPQPIGGHSLSLGCHSCIPIGRRTTVQWEEFDLPQVTTGNDNEQLAEWLNQIRPGKDDFNKNKHCSLTDSVDLEVSLVRVRLHGSLRYAQFGVHHSEPCARPNGNHKP